MTLAAVIVGPVGIALGFGLSTFGDRLRWKREEDQRTSEEHKTQAIEILRAAATVEGEGRNLAHAAYQSGTSTRKPDSGQVLTALTAFNTAMADLDRLCVEAEVFGPDGLAEIGRTLQERGRDLVSIVSDMQRQVTAANVKTVQEETIPAMGAALKKATEDVRTLLSPGAVSLA